MHRMFARRMSHIRTSGGADQVMWGISLPSDTVVHDIRCKVKGLSQLRTLGRNEAHMLAYEVWILPVLDPDAANSYDDLFDNLVPKDTDVQTLDLDTAAFDTTPFYEPGEADWTSLMDVGLRPERLYHRHEIKTMNANAAFIYQDNQTPFDIQWVGGERFQVHIKRRLRVRQPSVLVMACATPSFDDTTAVVQGNLLEAEWPQIKYVGHVLERALLHLLGVTEVGAETPWEEATALLQKHLDPDVYEELGGSFTSVTYDLFSEVMIDHSVVGELGKQAITTGR